MVPDPLKQRLTSAWSTLIRQPLVLVAVISGSSLMLLFLGWLAADQRDLSHAGSRPSLLELLDQVSKEKEIHRGGSIQYPPGPPRARSWTSPLARQCSGIDPNVRSRLEALERNRSAWRKDLPIDPTNYGERHKRDAFGQALDVTPRLVVMHETVYSMTSAINTFLTPSTR